MHAAPSVDVTAHHRPADRIALGFTKGLRSCADTFFACRHGHCAIVLETVAAVPGMVGATITHCPAEIDAGREANVAAPALARNYWKLPAEATLRDVVLVVRADEGQHRDVNHRFAGELARGEVDEQAVSPYLAHADDIRVVA